MRINNNIASLNSHRQYSINNTNISKSVEKLSSGYRINRAGDDAAGLAISEKMRAQIRGLNMASKNSQDAISLVQTAEGALQTTHDILQRMREIAVQASSDTNQKLVDREALDQEFQALLAEIDDTADKTAFNDMKLINGSFAKTEASASYHPVAAGVTAAGSMIIQTGANKGDELKISISAMHSKALGLGDGQRHLAAAGAVNTTCSVRTQSAASAAISAVNKAINTVSTQRAALGALQNRLEFKIQNLDISAENLQAAESRIRDVDMAKQMTNFTKNNILFQASTAMLAQANSLPQGVLQLLG